MSRPKLPRKSTSVDMTAMCDVAFLLLSFFILTTKFKPSEAITVTTPNSVSSKKAPEKDVVLITIDPEGKVFISLDDVEKKEFIANTLNTTKNMKLDVTAFKNADFFGASFATLPAFLATPKDKRIGKLLPGIPCKDSLNNEVITWMTVIKSAYENKKMNLLLKGDNAAKYPAFKNVIDAFKRNDILKFQMITNPENAPVGSNLWKEHQKGIKTDE